MTSPMLATDYAGQEPSEYWIAEKFDGVRAIWDGERFRSRNGKEFDAPAEWLEAMPRGVVLDGELWAGYGALGTVAGEVRAKGRGWERLVYLVFDLVAPGTCEERRAALEAVELPGMCERVELWEAADWDELNALEEAVHARGGEGLVLRERGSAYEHGRSDRLMKLKQYETPDGDRSYE